MDKIRYIKLKNTGAFVARIRVEYLDPQTSSWAEWNPSGYHDICASAERTVDLKGDAGLPNGSGVRLVAVVVAGKDKRANEQFEFDENATAIASYKVSGTTLIDKLTLESVG